MTDAIVHGDATWESNTLIEKKIRLKTSLKILILEKYKYNFDITYSGVVKWPQDLKLTLENIFSCLSYNGM